MENREQQLIDIMFEMGITFSTMSHFKDKTNEQIAEWIRIKLKANGFDTEPCGSSWGVLKK